LDAQKFSCLSYIATQKNPWKIANALSHRQAKLLPFPASFWDSSSFEDMKTGRREDKRALDLDPLVSNISVFLSFASGRILSSNQNWIPPSCPFSWQ
jgi:hypothetical protein